jgi:nucleoside-diphosphate-sugar epimerase
VIRRDQAPRKAGFDRDETIGFNGASAERGFERIGGHVENYRGRPRDQGGRSMAKVLITGGTGFIGAKLTERLVARGDDVTCLVRVPGRCGVVRKHGARVIYGDVRDCQQVRQATAGCDMVYHLAGLVSAFRLRDMISVNVDGFRNVVEACAASETPPTLVMVSSLAAAGPSTAERPRVESDPPAPVSNYGRSKRAAEQLAQNFAARVPITIVRPPIVYGEGDVNMLSVYRSIYRLRLHAAFGVAHSRYSLVHVCDLVEALLLCCQSGKRLLPMDAHSTNGAAEAASAAGYYFVAGDEQPTFGELGQLIGKALNRRVLVCGGSRTFMLWSVAAGAEAIARLRRKPYIFNFDKAREAQAGSWTCSALAIQSQLGFRPSAPLVVRLQQTADWYLQQKLL